MVGVIKMCDKTGVITLHNMSTSTIFSITIILLGFLEIGSTFWVQSLFGTLVYKEFGIIHAFKLISVDSFSVPVSLDLKQKYFVISNHNLLIEFFVNFLHKNIFYMYKFSLYKLYSRHFFYFFFDLSVNN